MSELGDLQARIAELGRRCTPYAGGGVLIGPVLLQELAAELQADRERHTVMGYCEGRPVATAQWDRTHPAGRHLLDELHAIGTYRAERAQAEAEEQARLRREGQQWEADQLLRVAEDVDEESDRD